jgi:hypothetical protein
MSAADALVLRLSVPARGVLREVASDVANKVAAYLGDSVADARSVSAALAALAARVAPDGADAEITFEFSRVEGELVIAARCGSQSSEVRCPLPA